MTAMWTRPKLGKKYRMKTQKKSAEVFFKMNLDANGGKDDGRWDIPVSEKLQDDFPLGVIVREGDSEYEDKYVFEDVYSGSTLHQTNNQANAMRFSTRLKNGTWNR